MVLPGIITNVEKIIVASTLKKTYAELNNVLDRAIADYGEPNGWEYQSSGELEQWVNKYIVPYITVYEKGKCPTNGLCLGVLPRQTLGYHAYMNNSNGGQVHYMIKKPGNSYAWGFSRYGGSYQSDTRIYIYIKIGRTEQYSTHKAENFAGKNVFRFSLDMWSPRPRIEPYGLYAYNPNTKNRVVRTKTQLLTAGALPTTGTHFQYRGGACNKVADGSDYSGAGDACAAVIMLDGWKITDDYPWR